MFLLFILGGEVMFQQSIFTQADLEDTNCPLCGGYQHIELYQFSPFRVVQCAQCSFVFLNPRLKEEKIIEYYSSPEFFDIYSKGFSYIYQESALRKTFRRFVLELNRKGLTGGRLLEVGCAYGYFLREARRYFDYCVETDFSPQALDIASRYANAIYCGGINDLPSQIQNFDLIVAINVIEHVYHPIQFLEGLKRRLTNNGTVVLVTPDFGSIWYKLLRNRWPSFKPPEHVCLYTYENLKSLLQKMGLTNIQRLRFYHAFPLSLVASKIGIKMPHSFSLTLWFPWVMLAVAARKEH